VIRKVLFGLCLCALFSLGACRSKQPSLPVFGQIAGFSLTDQNGKRVTAADLRGKIWVSAFMFTRCPTICPRITRRMQELQAAAKQQAARITLLSFSVDPEFDTPVVLTAYAREFHVDTANWSFLTGDMATIKKTAVESFKLALEGQADSGAEHFGIVHGSHLVLVDSKLQIRGFYRSSDDDVASRLVSDVKRLNAE
jgi:protein SCO1/2